MKKFLSTITLSISLAVTSTAAFAGGDVSASHPTIWGGFYTGAHVGWGSLDADTNGYGAPADIARHPANTCGATAAAREAAVEAVSGLGYTTAHTGNAECWGVGSFEDKIKGGAVGGVHVGYNFQSGNLVFGIEGDYSKTKARYEALATYASMAAWKSQQNQNDPHPTALATNRTTVELDSLASVRGRLGWATGNTLIYATGGVAWADLDINQRQTLAVENGAHNLQAPAIVNSAASETLTGFVVGGGAEHMLTQGFSLRGDVLHYEFDDKGYDFNSTVVRAGFSIHLN